MVIVMTCNWKKKKEKSQNKKKKKGYKKKYTICKYTLSSKYFNKQKMQFLCNRKKRIEIKYYITN